MSKQARKRVRSTIQTPQTPRRSWRLPSALIVAAGLIAYSNSYAGVFVFDDEPAIVENPNIRRLWPLGDALRSPAGTTGSGRPAVSLTLAINYALAPTDARDSLREPSPEATSVEIDRFHRNLWGYHALNLLIHLLTALAIYGVVRRTLETAALVGRFGRHAVDLACATALVWVVHPLTTAAVTYVVQRAESLMALCYLTTLYCSIRAWGGGRWWQVAAVASCAIGMASKESMVTAPIAVLLWDYMFAESGAGSLLRQRWTLYVGLVATWILLAVLVSGIHRPDAAGFGFVEWPWWRYLLTQAGVILRYLWLTMIPSPLVLDYEWPPAAGWSALLPVLFVGGLLIATVWLCIRRWPAGFAGALFFLVLAPTSSVLPIVTEVAAEHRMYLPLAAVLAVAIVSGFLILVRWRVPLAAGWIAIVIIVAVLTAGTLARNRDYYAFETIWRDTVEKRPENARAQHNYATALLARGRYQEAEQHLRVAVRIRPPYAEAQGALGTALCAQGRFDEGIEHLKLAVDIAPHFAGGQQSLGEAYASQGRMALAVSHYERALDRRPDDVMLMNRIGWILATDASDAVRNGSRALALGERAVQLTGRRDAASLDTLAAAQAEVGRTAEAANTAREALAVATARGERDYVPELRERLKVFEAGQPFRQRPSREVR